MDKYVKPWDVPKGQRWSYFWSYYKVHTIVGIVVLVMVGTLIKDVFFREKPDLTVTVATSGYLSDEATAELQRVFEEYSRDYNENGKKYVDQYEIYLSTEVSADPQLVMAGQTKLLAQFQIPEAIVFLMDQAIYDYLDVDEDEGVFVNLTQAIGEEAAPYVSEDGRRMYCRDIPILKDSPYANMYSELFFVVRDTSAMGERNQKKSAQPYQNSIDFLRNLVNDRPED